MTHDAQRRWLALLLPLALAHSLAYALLTPLWQAPDEPLLFEYAALTAELGRPPQPEDRSPALEARLLDSLWRNQLWQRTLGWAPPQPPATLEEALAVMWMPRQVGGDPPLYFAAAALPLRLLSGRSLDTQARLLRLLNALTLPLLALCAYGAARELERQADARATEHTEGTEERPFALRALRPLWPARSHAAAERLEPSALPLAAAALIALHPMLASVSGAVGNDPLANLCGAAAAYAWLRLLRRGVTLRSAALVAAPLALGLLSKRTVLPLALVLGAAAVLWLALRLWRSPARARLQVAVGLAALVAVAGGVAAAQLDWRTAWGWYWYGSGAPVERAWPAGHAALRVSAGQLALFPLPPAAASRVRPGDVVFGARVWGDGDAVGRLVVLNDQTRHEVRFLASPAGAQVETSATVYKSSNAVLLGLEAERGTLYAEDLWAEGDGVRLIGDGRLLLPGVRSGTPLEAALKYLRAPDVAWALMSGPPAMPERWGEQLFASFWGQFGWMHVYYVLGAPWAGLLGALCAAGALGVPLMAWRASAIGRRQIAALAALCALGPLLVWANAIAMPAGQVVQQGRYLFPLLVPLALLLAGGQQALVPLRARPVWLAAWVAGMALLAAGGLLTVRGFYGG